MQLKLILQRLQFYLMQNFNINLPSIPTGSIQFKLQDGKFKGFNSKQARFKDNLSYLTSHFINSFPNLVSPPKKQPQRVRTPASTQISSSFHQESSHFRLMVPDDKKNLLVKYEEEYKHYRPEISGENKYDKGFSFGKGTPKDTLDSELQSYSSQQASKEPASVFDNYYFNHTEQSEDEEDDKAQLEKRREQYIAKKRIVRKSAVFESQDRWKNFQRQISSKVKPGPGYYKIDTPLSHQNKKVTLKKDRSIKSLDIAKVIDILGSPVNPQQASPSLQKKADKEDKSSRKKSSMFFEGNLNRFGEQVYPISPKLRVPGPGAYHYHDSLQDKANRILIVQQQRKLLKEWYNDS